MTGSDLIYPAVITLACALEMLVQDTVWTVATKAIAHDKRFIGATFNSIGDGLSRAATIVTVVIVAAATSRSVAYAQVAGDMVGAFVGVYTGNMVAAELDRLFEAYHRHPLRNPISVLYGTIGHFGLHLTDKAYG